MHDTIASSMQFGYIRWKHHLGNYKGSPSSHFVHKVCKPCISKEAVSQLMEKSTKYVQQLQHAADVTVCPGSTMEIPVLYLLECY